MTGFEYGFIAYCGALFAFCWVFLPIQAWRDERKPHDGERTRIEGPERAVLLLGMPFLLFFMAPVLLPIVLVGILRDYYRQRAASMENPE